MSKNVLTDYLYSMKEFYINPNLDSKNPFKRLYGNYLKRKIYKKIEKLNLSKMINLDFDFLKSFVDLLKSKKTNPENLIALHEPHFAFIMINTRSSVLELEDELYNNEHAKYFIALIPRKKEISVKISRGNYSFCKRFKGRISEDTVDGVSSDYETPKVINELKVIIKKHLLLYIID